MNAEQLIAKIAGLKKLADASRASLDELQQRYRDAKATYQKSMQQTSVMIELLEENFPKEYQEWKKAQLLAEYEEKLASAKQDSPTGEKSGDSASS